MIFVYLEYYQTGRKALNTEIPEAAIGNWT